MLITSEIWNAALLLEKNSIKNGEYLGKYELSKLLHVKISDAYFIRTALNNKHLFKSITPIEIEPEGVRELILTDLHFPYCNRINLEAALILGEKENVNLITGLGDWVDMYQISRFIKKVGKHSVSKELEICKEFIKELNQRFPKARKIFYKGNHENHIERYILESAPAIADVLGDLLYEKLSLKEFGFEYPLKPFQIGRLWHLHGDEKPIGSGTAEYVTNVMFKYINDHCIFGHYHRSQDKIFPHIDNTKRYNVVSVGWMGNQEACEYARLNNYNCGFARVDYQSNGNFKVRNYKVIDGELF
jgi:predicted phosphodiesterase